MTESGNTSAGNISIANGTLDLQKDLSLTGGTLDMVSGSTLSIENNGSLVIKGGTFVADACLLVSASEDGYQANGSNGISDANIVGTDGNLNLRWFDSTYTADEYASVKQALMNSGNENATLNILNATLELNNNQALVVGATQSDNGVTIQMAPVVAKEGETPENAADANREIDSVPNQIVSVVAADDSAKELLPADTITVSGSKFTAKGLEIAGTETQGAGSVILKVTDSSDITLTGGEGCSTGVVAGEEAVATAVTVEGATLNMGLAGNTQDQGLTLAEATVAQGGTLNANGGGEGTSAYAIDSLKMENGSQVNVLDSIMQIGDFTAEGGAMFVDPAYVNIGNVAGAFGAQLLVGAGSTVNIGGMSEADMRQAMEKAGISVGPNFTVGANQSVLVLGQNLTLGSTGKIVVDAGVDASGNISSGPVSQDAYFGNNSLLVVNGNTINGTTAAIDLANTTNKDLYVQNGAKLLIADAVAGQTYTVISGATNTDATTGTAFNDTSYTNASATGWKGANLLTSSDMVSLTSEDGTVFKSVSADAHTVFPNLSHELATAVNTLYGQQLNDVDADAMGVRFLSRATDNRYLGADKQAAASTIESAARMAFAGAVPQMTKMASDAGTNAVVNRLGFANPADGAQAMNAEGKIVDRNTTGFALWIAPLWQNQHGWGMEAGNLDYGFNGNLGGVSLGADYTFENAIRAGITFNIGGGYAESSGGDLNSTENRMTFWGLGAYAGWNYENFGLMADVSYTSTWNDLEQDMDGRMGMGDLEADVQATAISAGLRAEYKLETSVLDIIPHIGVRYMSLNTWGYDVDTNGGTVLEGDGFHQDIWTFPIGVTFSKDFTLDSGWFFKPSVDFSVIPAAGDIKAKQDVAFTGLPGTYEVETQMMDYLTWQGGVGIQMGNDNLSFGVNYTLQAGQNTTGHGVFGSFRYEF
ncbi:autotransporter domain-containing protein [Desulfovibrio piger]|uniref:autotransporter family protein n=1 Tax=Desulfovibrio piger TaxID=901 RepID=UPI0039F5BC91